MTFLPRRKNCAGQANTRTAHARGASFSAKRIYLTYHALANFAGDEFARSIERSVNGVSGRRMVSAAAEALGDRGDIDSALAAQADAEIAIHHLAEEHCDINALDTEGIVRQPFAIFIDSAGIGEVLAKDVHGSKCVLHNERAHGGAQQ